MSYERRLHPRASVKIEGAVRRQGSAAWEKVLIEDLGAGGTGVRLAAPLELQTVVKVRFRLEGEGLQEPLDVQADCMVVRVAGAASPVGLTAVAGLHFLALEPEAFEAVRTWVWNRLNPHRADD